MRIRKAMSILIVSVWALLVTIPSFAISETARIGEPAPDFAIETNRGQDIRLSDYLGTPVILHFWATWERDSEEDLLRLNTLAEALGDDVVVLGLTHFDEQAEVNNLLDELDISYINVEDVDGRIATLYQFESIPSTYFIDAEGVLQEVQHGQLREGMLEDWLGIAELTPTTSNNSDNSDAPIPAGTLERYTRLIMTNTDEGFPMLGNPDATVTVRMFMAVACIHCAEFHDTIYSGLLQRVEDGDINLVYVPMVGIGSIPNDAAANLSMMCAYNQDLFWEMMDTLYAWHFRFGDTAFENNRLEAGAEALDLDMRDWNDCMQDTNYQALFEDAYTVFSEYGLLGVPSVLVNDEIVQPNLDAINDAIDTRLRNRT
jgi:protein-disulfide isomerase